LRSFSNPGGSVTLIKARTLSNSQFLIVDSQLTIANPSVFVRNF
jgi:hypothetical protein